MRSTLPQAATPVTITGIDAEGQGAPIEVTTDPSSPIAVEDTWAFGIQSAITAGQQQSFTVPSGKLWQILNIYVEYASSGTVGDRQVEVLLLDNLGVEVGAIRAGVVQLASQTRKYQFAPGLADLTSFRDTNYLMTPIPPTWILPNGFTVTIRDQNAVHVAGDSFIVRLMYAERDA